jgi:sugar lactone lactonase YvrE
VSGVPGEINRLDASQLLTTGTLIPATRLSTPSASLFTLNSIAFDNQGVMWVASEEDSVLLGFIAGNEGATGSVTPAITINPIAGSIAAPTGIAFDTDGSLWMANIGNGTIVRFDKSQLARSGTPIPTVTITGVPHPSGLAFDASGTLWVTDLRANTVSRYLRGQLLTSGDKEPAIVLSSNAELLSTRSTTCGLRTTAMNRSSSSGRPSARAVDHLLQHLPSVRHKHHSVVLLELHLTPRGVSG